VSNPHDGTIKVWNIVTGELLHTLRGHTSPVMSFAITSDNSKVISSSTDMRINVWDVNTGKLLWRYRFDSYMMSINSFRDVDLIVMVDRLGNGYVVCFSGNILADHTP
jgi:WD40 repeat protein